MSQVRVRFAPSPTGFLHVGGARTALFNWLYARKTGGKFLLRIEDTDRQRSSEEHVQVILRGLAWLGLDVDEEIVFQGAGIERHRQLADRLLAEGKAYEDEGAVRFRMPDDEISWDDVVHGRISFSGSDIKDWIILRSDRTPTYNFTVVADDMEMQITLVLRGDDHISNTPKQVAVYRALGYQPPVFAHVPMIHGPDGKKMSKRHGATAIGEYRALGILAPAMRNFLALLGWNPGDDRELYFTTEELIDAFSLERVQKKAAIFDITKLEWMNGQYMSQAQPEDLLPLIESGLKDYGVDSATIERTQLLRAIDVTAERARTTIDLARRVAVRFNPDLIVRDDPRAGKLIAKDPDGFRMALRAATERLTALKDDHWEPTRLETELRALADELGLGVGKVFQPIRVAITGETVSEPVNFLLEVVGKDESLRRMVAAERQVGG
ncbi:MAG: glutamate--tRNA ligase [Gemmatimonadales bacterium]